MLRLLSMGRAGVVVVVVLVVETAWGPRQLESGVL